MKKYVYFIYTHSLTCCTNVLNHTMALLSTFQLCPNFLFFLKMLQVKCKSCLLHFVGLGMCGIKSRDSSATQYTVEHTIFFSKPALSFNHA